MHDFEPGIAKNGSFWTIAVSDDSVSINLNKGTARFHMENLDIKDYFDIVNSLTDGGTTGPPVAATVSFDVRWKSPFDHYKIEEETQGFRGEFWQTDASINWSGANDDGASFDSSEQTTVIFAGIGRERNGKFA